MLQTSHSFNALGGEHCCGDLLAQEVEGAGSEDSAEIVQSEVPLLVQLNSQLTELLNAALGLVEGQDAFLVYVFPASSEVDESRHAIEGLFGVADRGQSELADDLFHYFLGSVGIGEVGVELVDDIGLAVLSGALPFFPQASLIALLGPLPLLLGDLLEYGHERASLCWTWG